MLCEWETILFRKKPNESHDFENITQSLLSLKSNRSSNLEKKGKNRYKSTTNTYAECECNGSEL